MTLNTFKIKPKISLINKMSAFTERELIQDKKKKEEEKKKGWVLARQKQYRSFMKTVP